MTTMCGKTFFLAGLVLLAATATAAASPAGCGQSAPVAIERRYIVKARVRPLLFWTARREVGQAWFRSRDAAGGRRMELLIGTDPARAPLQINRWGYIAEAACDDGAELIGLMTESNEQTVEQAQETATTRQRNPLKAIRARSGGGQVHTEILAVSPPDVVTYRDLDRVLALLPAAGAMKTAAVPDGADSGFLVAVTSLIRDSVAAYRESGRVSENLRRVYVYAGRVYDIALRASTTKGQAPGSIESEFHVRNRLTGTTNEFTLAYAAAGSQAEEVTRIVYRPRWWLEIELQHEAGR
jgi:hypothetical protein